MLHLNLNIIPVVVVYVCKWLYEEATFYRKLLNELLDKGFPFLSSVLPTNFQL